MRTIDTVEELAARYGEPGQASLVKEVDRIIPEYAAFIEASPFVAVATSGPDGLDCSPRGDAPCFVRIHDERTLTMPDRPGNNRPIRCATSCATGASDCFFWFRLDDDIARQRQGRARRR